jgi:hypothetical protein
MIEKSGLMRKPTGTAIVYNDRINLDIDHEGTQIRVVLRPPLRKFLGQS